MKAQNALLFVYGSLLGSSAHPMAAMLRANADLIGVGEIQGRLFQIDWYPGVVHSAVQQDRVAGEVYRLRDPASLLPLLDAYEETGPGFPEPAEFRRELAAVQLAEGSTLRCWVYFYNR